MQAGPSYAINAASTSQAAAMMQAAGPSYAAGPPYAADMQRPRVDMPIGSPGYSQEALAHARLFQATQMENSGAPLIET